MGIGAGTPTASDRESLALALEAARMGIWDWDVQSGEIVWSSGHEALWGMAPGTFGGTYEDFEARVHPEDRAGLAHDLQVALQDRGEFRRQFRVIRPDGSERWIESRGSFRYDPDGKATRMLGVVLDVTAARRAEEERARLSARAEAAERERIRVLERVSDACVALDRDWRYTYVNPQAGRLFGRDAADLVGKLIWTEFPEGVGQPFHLAYERALAEQMPIELEDYYAPWDRWFENRIYPAPDGLTIFFHEITERKRAERAEREATELARQIIAHAPEGVAAFDRELRYVFINPTLCRMTELSGEDVVGRRPRELIPAPFAESIEARLGRALGGEVVETHDQRTTTLRTGRPMHLSSVLSPLRDGGGEIIGVLAFVRDATNQRRAELLVQCQSHVLEQVASGAGLGTALDALARGVEELTPGMLCSILLLDPDGIHLRHGAAPSLPAEYVQVIDGSPIGPKAGSCGTSAFTGSAVLTEDIETDPLWDEYRHLARPFGLRACWSTPIVDAERRVRGTFALYYREPLLPEPWQLEIVSMATSAAVIAIESEQSRRELADSQQRYRDLYENAPDMYVSVDVRAGTIRECNETLVRVTGFSKGELVGRPVLDLYDPSSAERAREALAELVRVGEIRDVSLLLRRKRGDPLDVSLNATAVRASDGTVVQSRSILRDITRQQRAEDELRRLSASLLQLQDEERRRIARELHDTTVQSLAALAMNLTLLEPDRPRDRSLLETCISLADQSSQELRTLSYVLHPPMLEEFGLVRAVREYADGFAKRSGIAVEVEAPRDLERLTRDSELALFRVLQESLSNVHRHSGSSRARVRLSADDERIELEIADEGTGTLAVAGAEAAETSVRLGVGIPGMRERLRQLGGRLEVASGPSGVRVRAIAPKKGGAS